MREPSRAIRSTKLGLFVGISRALALGPAVPSLVMMASTAGTLFAAGGVLAFASIAVGPSRPSNQGAMLFVAAVAVVVALLTLLYGRYLPRWVFTALVCTGTMFISTMVYLAGGGAGSLQFGSLYAIAAMASFSFFTTRLALAQMAFLELSALIAFTQ